MNRPARHTARRVVAAALAGATLLTGCQHNPMTGTDSTTTSEDAATMNLSELPTLKETKTQMLALIVETQREIVRQVPASAPWRWTGRFSTTTCTGGMGLFFPNLYSDHALTDDEWARAFPAVRAVAERAGLSGVGGMQNSSGNHDMSITGDDGRELRFGSRDATVLSASVGCRRVPDDTLWVDGRIPMPPDPQP